MTHYEQGREAHKNGIPRWALANPEFWDGVHRFAFLRGYEDAAQEDLDYMDFEIFDEDASDAHF